MNKSLLKNILAVLLGISLLIVLFSFVSLIMEAVFANDLFEYGGVGEEIIYLIKWSAVGFVCILAPAIAGAVFCLFSKNKFMPLFPAVLFLFVAVSAIGVSAAIREKALTFGSTAYATAIAYVQELVQLAIPSFLICGYFAYVTVTGFLAEKTVSATATPAAAQTVSAGTVPAEDNAEQPAATQNVTADSASAGNGAEDVQNEEN